MTRFSSNRLQTQLTIALSLVALTTTSGLASPQNRTRFEGASRTRSKNIAAAAPKASLPVDPAEPEDETTINVTLETGDEELDHTLGASEDTIGKSRAAVENLLGPRNGRTPASRSKLISRALSYRGARYRFGASGTNGVFDCSSFVQHLMRGEGVGLPRTAREQFTTGKRIAKEDLRPGDLVFFAGTYRAGISHVGMYVGDGMFVHAASSKRGVVLDPLDLPYYNSKYAGARRMK